jgi:hypothetical protein
MPEKETQEREKNPPSRRVLLNPPVTQSHDGNKISPLLARDHGFALVVLSTSRSLVKSYPYRIRNMSELFWNFQKQEKGRRAMISINWRHTLWIPLSSLPWSIRIWCHAERFSSPAARCVSLSSCWGLICANPDTLSWGRNELWTKRKDDTPIFISSVDSF